MSRVRVKICGITRVVDAQAAVESGADAIGLVFYSRSPRAVQNEQAAEIAAVLPAFVSSVGLFVDPDAAEVEAVLERVPLSLLQFHGDETAEFCNQFGVPYIKALRVQAGMDLNTLAADYAQSRGILVDAYVANVPGGTGKTFDWSLIPEDFPKPLILAGGLHVDNVVEAVKRVRPYAVDVSGGVEKAKGIKDEEKISAFIRGVTGVTRG